MCKTPWLVRVVFCFLVTCAGSLALAHAQTSAPEASCPNQSFGQIQHQFTPAAAPRGEVLIDRAIFWKALEKLVAAREVFRFKNSKGIEKAVSFDRSILDGDHRAAIEAIFDQWEGTTPGHPKHLALMLGTAYRETCGLLSSGVGEACGCKKTCSISELQSSSYGRKDSCGRAYFGRGFVQLTHRENYEKLGKKLGVPLMDYPDLAYDNAIAVTLLVQGVQGQWFAGKLLTNYLNDERSDWVNARDAVNPGSPNKAATGYLSCRFYDAIQQAYKKPAPTQAPAVCMQLKNPPPTS